MNCFNYLTRFYINISDYKTVLIFVFFPYYCFSQFDSISYENMFIDTSYRVNSGYECMDNKCKYFINEKKVSKKIYLSYQSKFPEVNYNCTPCITKYFDVDRNLISEGEYYRGNNVGYYNEFYKNGGLKVRGKYKTLPLLFHKDSTHLFNIKDCLWSYYNEKGEKLYDELWKDGFFIKQDPEQTKPEIWQYKLYLNDSLISKHRKIEFDEISKIVVVPFYKNKNHDSSKLHSIISVYVGRLGKTIKTPHDSFVLDDILKKNSLSLSDICKTCMHFQVYYDKEYIIGHSIDFNFQTLKH